MRTFISVYRQPYSMALDIYIGHTDNQDREFIAEPLIFKEYKPPGIAGTPTLALHHRDTGGLQQLVNELWEIGIRAEQAKGSTGQLQATEKHLEDMRALALQGMWPLRKTGTDKK